MLSKRKRGRLKNAVNNCHSFSSVYSANIHIILDFLSTVLHNGTGIQRQGALTVLRLNVRAKIGSTTFFFMISKTQRLTGVTNKIGKDDYVIFWDLEGCTLGLAIDSLQKMKQKYNLAQIFVVTDHPLSWRAYCFTRVTFREYIKIICDTKYVDWNFIRWSVVRGEATLRTSQKEGRPKQRVAAVIPSAKDYVIPQHMSRIVYDTGNHKKGLLVVFDNGALKIR